MKRILIIGLGKTVGGVEVSFHNYYQHLSLRKYKFDFVTTDETIAFADEYKKAGSEIYSLPDFRRRPISYRRKLAKVLQGGNYDIVHIHMLSSANIIPVQIAKKLQIPRIVVHSHSTSASSIPKKVLAYINRPFLKDERLVKLTCSEAAGQWLFGKKSERIVIKNAIDQDAFRFNPKHRQEIREKYNLKDSDFVVGHVGRFSKEKNQAFLVELMKTLPPEYDNIKLLLVGDGKIRKQLETEADERVVFAGNTSEVNKFYSAFDLFVLPSHFEGAPIAALEAQANGLDCIFSDKVPHSTSLNEHNRFISLENPDAWNLEIVRRYGKKDNRENNRSDFEQSGFNIDDESQKLAKIYDKPLKNHEKIDFVITWLDDQDPIWRKDKAKHSGEDIEDDRDCRYRDWDTLKYWFRAVEKYAPWVNKVYFVTYGHLPKWLNTDHPKLKIVKHEDFIPEEYLPTFNSVPIEMNLHRIKSLSENFVFFNDDFFLFNPTKPTDFFKNNLPKDSASLYANIPSGDVADGIFNSDVAVINRHFDAKSVIRKHPLKWYNLKNRKYLYNTLILRRKKFTGIRFEHLPNSFKKSTFRKLWKAEPDAMAQTSAHKFRTSSDINQWALKYWQICEGNFAPRDVNWGKYYEYGQGDDALKKLFKNKRYKVVCLNDSAKLEDFEHAKKLTKRLFEEKFPEKSTFERREK